MSPQKKARSKNSNPSRVNKAPPRGSARDENVVSGTVANGGVVVQGGEGNEYNIQIIQTPESKPEEGELRLAEIQTKIFEPKTVLIPEGSFWMGRDAGDDVPEYETPRHEVSLPAYRIGIAPVTNAQYEVFVQETGTRVLPIMGWFGQRVREDRADFPVAGITFHEVRAYCEWLSQKTGRDYTVPNEAQWEKACRAGTESRYPWGEEFDPERSNLGKSSIASVYAYPAQNEYGLLDLVGNIRQWTLSLWGENRVQPDLKFGYPWKNDRRNDTNASRQVQRVIRGCSFAEEAAALRCTARKGQLPEDAGWIGAGIGFRVAMNL